MRFNRYRIPFVVSAMASAILGFGLLAGCGRHPVRNVEMFNVGVNCHLQPTPGCSVAGSMRAPADDLDGLFRSTVVTLEPNNTDIRSGAYLGGISLLQGTKAMARAPLHLLVSANRVKLELSKRMLRVMQALGSGSGPLRLRWHASGLPITVAHRYARKGSIEILLTKSGHTVATGTAYLQPAKGCWFREVQCRSH